ncbi:MAG: AAA family ATPase [Planctomycetes bacterium]|nr:AAA family ATPase [Planctomycetota bacterium]
MIVSHITLKNWRNFQVVDVPLGDRVFLVGPNASGKSNFLDAFRFLRDIAKAGGGLQRAVGDRGGLSKIRCLAARRYPDVEIDVTLSSSPDNGIKWRYAIGMKQQTRGARKPFLAYERVWQDANTILDRPDDEDRRDAERLTQTHLEQISANVDFREVARFLESVSYLHVVPQLIRHPRAFTGPGLPGDPFGRSLLERIGKTNDRTKRSRLKKIETALRIAVPQLKKLSYVVDSAEGGIPHLEAVYDHWRPQGAKQRESEFSDGTLRLVGLLWSLLEREAPLLLEEPELSLNAAIVRKLPALIHRMTRKNRRQVLISTHSAELLSDKGVGPDETLLLVPSPEGTTVRRASEYKDIRDLLEGGLSIGDVALPRIDPENMQQLLLFET